MRGWILILAIELLVGFIRNGNCAGPRLRTLWSTEAHRPGSSPRSKRGGSAKA